MWPNPSKIMQFGLENGWFKVRNLQNKLFLVEIDIDFVKDKQKTLDEKFTHIN